MGTLKGLDRMLWIKASCGDSGDIRETHVAQMFLLQKRLKADVWTWCEQKECGRTDVGAQLDQLFVLG